MILIPHIIVGAVIGAKIRKPFLIILLGFLSHFVLDRIPHWDYHFSLINSLIDIIVGLIIVFLALRKKRMLNKNYVPYVVLGIFIALLPDVLWSINSFLGNNILDQYTIIHNKIHYTPQKEGAITFLGISSQIAVIVISLLILFAF